ncbi:MAG: Mur ligase domain-containing protein, partial [Pseudomonadota bacterium]
MAGPAKSLADLGLADPGGDGDRVVTGICVDSRICCEGELFAALPGTQQHGATFAAAALSAGAGAVLTDAEGAEILGPQPGLPVLVSKDPRRALSLAASRFFAAQPATVVAVTGTNGKT